MVSVALPRRYVLPGGSAGHFKHEGYTFDVGSSMMFGLNDKVGGRDTMPPMASKQEVLHVQKREIAAITLLRSFVNLFFIPDPS